MLLGEGTTVTLDERDDYVGSPLLTPMTLIEHGVGLANSGCGAQVHAETTSVLDHFR